MAKKSQPPNKPRDARLMSDSSKFNQETFEEVVKYLKKTSLPRAMISDPVEPGLRVMVRKSGSISFHVHYTVGTSRPMIDIGEAPEMTIDRARKIARSIIAIADKGIDPRDGLHKRLVAEIEKVGDKWKP
jgi:Arm DNA-binding domain